MSSITFIMAWVVALIAMTSFSALWSTVTKRQFREHILLAQTLGKTDKDPKRKKYIVGWAVHIIMGCIFLILYEFLWMFTGFPRTLKWALVFGSILGILGIIGWTVMFKMFSKPNHLNTPHFFVHLFFAHLIFSLTALWVYIGTN